MAHQIHRLGLALAAAFVAIALAGGYWGVVRQEALTGRADNPRRALAERRAPRGTIFDRHGAVLAESVGRPGEYTRRYPYPDLAPVIGYVSVFYGTAGVEAALDAVLHGDVDPTDAWEVFRDRVLGAPSPGRDVRLSIDLALQSEADERLRPHTGAAVVVDAATGEVLALASHPTFDPNTLDDDWPNLVSDERAPLLNRASLALYQPGGALQPIVLAGALRAGLATAGQSLAGGTNDVLVGSLTVACQRPPEAAAITVAQALILGCPKPFADLGEALGPAGLEQLFSDFRLYTAPPLRIPSAASPRADLTSEVRTAALGQGSLNITPLQLALATAALVRQGDLPPPHLVLEVQERDGAWQAVAPLSHSIAAVAPDVANEVRALMSGGHQATALVGEAGEALAWFAGYGPAVEARYVVVVLLEGGTPDEAADIGRDLLDKARQLAR